jgi:putative protease
MYPVPCEILAPAGRPTDITPLIDNGADAIYVGLSGYSARPKSSDFTLEEMEQALALAHRRDVKLFAAVNANVPDAYLPQLCEKLAQLDDMGIDALILSDYGLMKRASGLIRRAQLHASTLTGVYNYEDVKMLREMGIKRIILSSDLFIDEIADIIENVPDMDYEIVADGGICFNSNRQCLLPHFGQKEGYSVFCQKDYTLLKNGTALKRAERIGNCPGKIHHTMGIYLGLGIGSFKIEGRTNALDYILQRVRDAAQSKTYFMEHSSDIPGMMHYIRRSNRYGEKL